MHGEVVCGFLLCLVGFLISSLSQTGLLFILSSYFFTKDFRRISLPLIVTLYRRRYPLRPLVFFSRCPRLVFFCLAFLFVVRFSPLLPYLARMKHLFDEKFFRKYPANPVILLSVLPNGA